MNKTQRIALLIFIAPIVVALLYIAYYRESRRVLIHQLAESGVVALVKKGAVTRDDLQNYFHYPPVEEDAILRSLEFTPEDVKELGLDEKDRELFKEVSGQVLLLQVIKHLALIKYLIPRFPLEKSDQGFEEEIRAYRESLLIEAMDAELAGMDPAVTQEEMLNYYVEHPDEFYRQGKRYSRYLMLTQNPPEDGDDESASIDPEPILNRLRSGEDFSSLIQEIQSSDSGQGGLLGWTSRGMLNSKFEKVLWALDIGEITGPIPIDDTFHFVQLLDEQVEELLPFKDCRSRIQTLLKESRRTQNRSRQLGLNSEQVGSASTSQEEAYRQAILHTAKNRGWDQNSEIINKTDAYIRYRQANRVFETMIHPHSPSSPSQGGESNWELENQMAQSLLKEMDFRLLVHLNLPSENN